MDFDFDINLLIIRGEISGELIEIGAKVVATSNGQNESSSPLKTCLWGVQTAGMKYQHKGTIKGYAKNQRGTLDFLAYVIQTKKGICVVRPLGVKKLEK